MPTTARKVALVMIARDASRSIERALRSAAPYVHEMVVLDTGSLDDTVAIARRVGAHVEFFPWIDDFAAARNAALELADAEWNVILDSDEWIAEGGPSLLGLAHDSRRYVGLARCSGVTEQAGMARTYHSESVRILPRGIRYEFPVHEQPVHDLPGWYSPIRLGHDGYTSAVLAAKSGRNRALLERALSRHRAHPYLSFKLGQELREAGEAAEGVERFRTAYDGCPADAPWRHPLVLGFIRCLGDAGLFDEAIDLADVEMATWAQSPDFFFVLGNLFLDLGVAHPERAAGVLHLIEECYLRCLELGDRPELEGSVIGHGSFLAAKNLHAYYVSVGAQDQATHAALLEVQLRTAADVTA